MDSGWKNKNMDMVSSSIQMVLPTLGTLKKEKHMGKGDYIITMEISTLETGQMIKHMGLESIWLAMEEFMKETGSMIKRKVMENNIGLMVLSLRGDISKVRKMEKESSNLPTVTHITVNSKIIKRRDTELCHFLMGESIKGLGLMIKWKVEDNSYGLKERHT